MTALRMVLTNAGRAAQVAADAGGTAAIRITHAGLTAAKVTASPTLIALPGEFKRVADLPGLPADAYTIHLIVRDSSADEYAVRGIGLYLDNGTLFAVYAQDDPIFEKVAASHFLMAIDWKFENPEAINVTFGNTNFLNPPATEATKGVAYLSTIAEALAGAVSDKIITPATMRAVLDSYVNAELLGAPGGVATLGPDGKLLLSQRPPIDLIDVWPVANTAARLALGSDPAVSIGDFAVQADNGLVYVLAAMPVNDPASWLEISTPAPVSSVNGKVGTVVLTAADIGAVPVGRVVKGEGLLAGQGGPLNADRTFSLAAASAAEALGGLVADKVLTPASLASLLNVIAGKASAAGTVTGAGVLAGQGGSLAGNPVLNLSQASGADLISAQLGDRVATPASFGNLPKSLTPNGYYVAPGGLIFQWIQFRQLITYEAVLYVSFPIAFPNAALMPIAMGYIDAPSNVRDLWPQQCGPADTYGMRIQLQTDDGKDMRLEGINLLVIGY